MRGRRPKPDADHELAGTRPERLRGGATFRALVELPPAPAWLTVAGREEWRVVGAELVAGRVLSSVDLAVLAAYVEAIAEVRLLTGMVSAAQRKAGGLLKSGRTVDRLHPALAARREAFARLVSLAAQLGCSPAERVRVRPVGPAEREDVLERLLRNKREREERQRRQPAATNGSGEELPS